MTYKDARQRKMKVIALGVLAVALLIIAMYAAMLAQTHAREQAAVSVRESVLNAAKQCCAVEGSYPSTITHLEKEYGLVINHDDYVVSYEWFADNVLPSVVVTPR